MGAKTFPNYRKEMASVNWGELYNQFKDKKLNTEKLEEEISKLMQDEDVSSKLVFIRMYSPGKKSTYLFARSMTK